MAEQYTRRRMGDRKDGRRLRTIDPLFQLIPFAVRDPSDGVNFFTDRADTQSMEHWLRTRRAMGSEDITIIHVFIAAYIRMLAHRPAMNRFVAGRWLFARNHIDVVISAGRNGAADTGAMTMKVRFKPTDTIFDVARRISARMDSIQADDTGDRAGALASVLVKTPRFVVRAGAAVMRWLDSHGWLSESLVEKSPFHGSLVISDEGSCALPSIARSLNSTGSLPVSLSIGRRSIVRELDREGMVQEKKTVEYTVSFDGRIADSAYVGSAFKYFRYYLDNPSELENSPERVNDDAM